MKRYFQNIKKPSFFLMIGVFFVLAFAACKKEDDLLPIPEPIAGLPTNIDDNLYRFGVNTNPYEYFNVQETPIPDGYFPFYISSYARHGSRGNVGVDYAPVIEAFTNAHVAGVLNEEGERAYQKIMTIYGMDNGTDGLLTQRGALEQRQIANRMYSKYSTMFLNGSHRLRAVSTTAPRCQESMAAFASELLSHDSQLDIIMNSDEQFVSYLSSSASNKVRARATELYREYDSIHRPDTMYFATHLFSNISSGREAVGGSIEQLLYGTMTFAAISGAFDLDQTLLNLFNLEDLKHYSRKLSQFIYMCQCNSIELGDQRMSNRRITALIEDFVRKADTAISNGEYIADLRFGHDSHLLAFCAKIGVKGIGERLETVDAVNWRGWLYTPFAANFYIVFYKNGSGNILAKCYINEREVKLIGLQGGPYYNWVNLRQYLISLCESSDKSENLNTDASEDFDIIIPR